MSWQNIEVTCGFGSGEETTRFGPRQETGSSLYQVDTVACISNKNICDTKPFLLSSSCLERMALVIDVNIIIFDESCSEHLCTFTADSLIDAFGWADGGDFLVFADRSGLLHFTHIGTQRIIFTKRLAKGYITKQCFSSISFIKQRNGNGLYELFIVTTDGEGFRFSNINLEQLNIAILENNIELASKIQSDMKMFRFNLSEYHNFIYSVTYQTNEEECSLIVAGDGDFNMSEWFVEDEEVLLNDFTQSFREVGFKKNLVSPDGQYIVSLDLENNISLWTRKNFIFIDCLQELKVEDFNLFITSAVETDCSDKSSKAKEDLKIVLLTVSQNKKRKLVVLSLPTFEHVYTLTVSECTVLAVLPSQQDNMMFIEGVPNENLDDSIECEKDLSLVGTIRVRSLMEAIPQNRFSRLLHKKKFSEAEDFAKMFNLDIELVHKVHSIFILDQLSPWDANLNSQDDSFYLGLMSELKVCLDKIEDMEHVANCCLQAQLPTLSATFDLLNYAQQKVNFKSRTFTKSSALFQALLDGINRLVTFDVAFGSSHFTGNSWSAFLSSSLLDEVIKCFTGLNNNAGIIIWRRHQSEFEKYFTEAKLQQILHSLENTPSKIIIPWLREDFVPYVLTVLPDGQCLLASWLERIARDLEYKEKESWPDNALDLAEVMYKAFSNLSQSTQGRGVATPMQFATKICKLSIPYFEGTEEDNLPGLRNSMKLLGSLVKSLREVKSLHHEYNCKLSLDQYLSENTKQITFRLLNRIAAAELIPQTIKKYVEPYVTKNNLKLENILHEYLIELVDMNIQLASLWEPKVIAIINEIKNKEKKCEATLKLMMKAQTPWSESVVNLVTSMLKICPENKNLLRQFQFAELRKMVAGYNIRDTNFADISKIEEVVKYMFNTNKLEALEDALKICKYFPSVTKAYVYFLRIQSWILSSKIYESCKLIEDLDIEDAINVANFCLVWYNSCFQPIDEEDMVEQMSITEALILLIHSVSKLSKSFKNDFQVIMMKLKNIYCLQKEFGVFLSLTQYDDSCYCNELIQNFVLKPKHHSMCESFDYKSMKKEFSRESQIIRFADLLQMNGANYHSLLIDVYIENQNYEEAFKHVCKLVKDQESGNFYQSLPQENLKILFKMAYVLVQSSKFNWVKGANDLHDFTSIALTLCKKDSICDYLAMCCLMRFVDLLGSQCESSDYQDDPKKVEGLIHEWILDEYRDDSLVISSSAVLPLIQNLVSLSIFVPSEDVLLYDSTRLTGSGVQCSVKENNQGGTTTIPNIFELIKTLHGVNELLLENNQQELALQLLMLGVSICAQHASNLQMGIPVDIENDVSLVEIEKCIEIELKAAQVILEKAEVKLTESCSNLVCSILGHRVVDHDLALCYLDPLSLKEGTQILLQLKNKFGSKYNRIQHIAQVGVDFAALQNDINLKKKCHAFKESAVWGRKLQTLRVPPPWNIYSVNSDPVERQRILEIIVQHKDIDLSSISLYCQSFSFDEEKALLMYIGNLLTPTNSMKPQFHSNYQEKIDEAIHILRNYENLERFMNNAIIKISPYDYERLAYTFKKIADVTENNDRKITCDDNIRLLEMLSEYNRTATDICYNMESATMADDLDEDQILLGKLVPPEVVKKRLPFHPLIKSKIQWSVLDSELTSEKNLLQLEPIANMLKLNTDQMFAKAVQNIAGPNLMKNQQQLEGRSFEFESVENILNMIKNHTVMIAAAKWLAKYLPRGTEKTKVLEAIVKRTSVLVAESNGEMQLEAKKAQQKFIGMYKRVSIEGALIEHGITDEKFFMVSSDAAKLVMMLYEEYGDKAKFETGKLVGAPEIYSLAKIIINISGDVELQKIHMHLVNKWLPCIRLPSSQNDEDDMMDSSSNVEAVRKENERNLRRVIYVLASSFDLNYIKMLVMAIYNQESELTNMCRIRAMQVLFTLVDISVIKREVQMDIENIYEKLVSCIYLSELENLHSSQSEEAFIRSNKETLVKGLWRNHSREPLGIRLISDICLDYKIYDPSLWNSLLVKLLSFDMISYLTHVLVLLSGVLELREIPSLTKTWKAVIISPFNSASSPLSSDEEKACLQASQLLTRCPVILDIGLPEIADVMKNTGLFIQALICIKLIPDQILRKKKIERLLDEIGIEVILAKVEKDREQGIMDGHLGAIEEEVYNYVNKHNLFVSLNGTVHFDKMIGYLIRSQKINNLLLKTITSGNLKNAVELITLYASFHPKSLVAQKINEGLDAKHALLVYLQEQGLLAETKKYFISHFKQDCDETSLIEVSFNNNSHLFNLTETR
ncbi:kinetochore-associated protein 1 isoform X2 [Hydra vulgaris]|uniref:Kinetochore-associated protein 1 isoform X2 n=1 Tax=Hydra vulgaris TaxID=6087 RepID=A0ABM4CG32_HYDVU